MHWQESWGFLWIFFLVGKWREVGTYASIVAEEEERDTFGKNL